MAADIGDVRLDGAGPVKIGMNLPELNSVLHTSYSLPKEPDEQACFYVDVPGHDDIGLMILNGRVARIDAHGTRARTAEGIHNGDTEAHALAVYGRRLKVSPHEYDPLQSHYLTLISPDGKLGIRFETDGRKIARYYAGTSEAIAFIEGCE